ncbi:hypothetical protein KIH79_12290, partial [Bifidobacterium sp. 82T10]
MNINVRRLTAALISIATLTSAVAVGTPAATAATAPKGLIGLIEEYGSPTAKNVISSDETFHKWQNLGLVKPAGSSNSFNLSNVRKAVATIDKVNKDRQSEGLTELKISDTIMLVAAGNNEYTNYKAQQTGTWGHTGDTAHWNLSENIGLGGNVANAELVWYGAEKSEFDRAVASGKYPNLAEHRHDSHWVYRTYYDLYEIVGHKSVVLRRKVLLLGDTSLLISSAHALRATNAVLPVIDNVEIVANNFVQVVIGSVHPVGVVAMLSQIWILTRCDGPVKFAFFSS